MTVDEEKQGQEGKSDRLDCLQGSGLSPGDLVWGIPCPNNVRDNFLLSTGFGV